MQNGASINTTFPRRFVARLSRWLKFRASVFYFRHVSSTKNRSRVARKLSRLVRGARSLQRRRKAERAGSIPVVIEPVVREVNVSLTSKCIYGCKGCSYGRSFLPGQQLEAGTAFALIDDLRAMSVPRIYFYGGEPLLHPRLCDFIAYAVEKGIYPVLGTNGLLLREDRVANLYRAGLRNLSIGIYGTGQDYDAYVDRRNSFDRLQENVELIRSRYPDMRVFLAWLLMKPTCNVASVREIWEFAKRNGTPFSVNLIHYDFPYFNEGPEGELQLYEEDRPSILAVVEELLRLKALDPDLMTNSEIGLRSIPDWLIKKQNMRVRCNMHDNIWVGPDGTVMVCQKNLVLGNLQETRMRDILYTKEHVDSAQACFNLECSNCHVRFDTRTLEDPAARARYESQLG